MNSLNEDGKVLTLNSRSWAAKSNAREDGRDIYLPADSRASWQIRPFWHNSLHTRYLETDHTKFYVKLAEFNIIHGTV